MKQIIKKLLIGRMPLFVVGKKGKLVAPFKSNYSADTVIQCLTESLYEELSTNEELLANAIKCYVSRNGAENLIIEIRKFQQHGILTHVTVQLKIN